MNYRNTTNQIEDFAGMAENYNTTKPVVSKNHTREDNIRPVGRRSRKWEHMIKVSAYKYMIYDGYTVGDPKFNRWGNKVPPTPEETLALAPIVWTLSPKGDIETIRIRNGSGDYAHCARYTFLENTLPRGLQFIVQSGKQYISSKNYERTGWVDDIKKDNVYLLPKSDYRPDYVGHTIHSKDDKKYLTFARKVGGGRYDWKVVGDTWKVQHERKRVDTKAKAKIKPHADVFYKWLDTMHSFIMPDFGDGYNRWRDRADFIEKARTELDEFLLNDSNHYTGYGWTQPNYEERPKEQHGKLLEIMSTDQHAMRTQLGIDFLRCVDFEHVTDGSQVRAKYNSYVNKLFGLVGTLTKEKIVKDK